jgi:signal transduction histidine kinase/CheY-like chemotaxis protein
VTLAALSATVAGRGAFAEHPGTPEDHALAAQVFCCVAVATTVFMASVVDARRRAAAERRALDERLRRAEKLEGIGRLAGGVAHDFNNQLTGILAGADHLAEALRDAPPLREVALEIREGAQRSARLTKQLLAFARRPPSVEVAVDVHRSVLEVVALLARSVDKRVSLRTDLAAPRALVSGDPDRVHAALLNLAINACDAMPAGGTLTIETRAATLDAAACAALPFDVKPGAHLRVVVRDTGVGLSPEARAHLFEPFFTTKPVGKGSGLGLAEVYGTVAAHEGAVTVESAPGGGTAVVLLLPLAAEAAPGAPAAAAEPVRHPAAAAGREPSASASAASPAAPAPAGRLCVLVVDDEPGVRRALGRILRRAGHEVVDCDSGGRALERHAQRAHEVDVAIVDMMMPDMTGREVIARLRARRPGLPVIVSSGFSATADLDAVRGERHVFLLPKPYLPEDVDRTIALAAAARR